VRPQPPRLLQLHASFRAAAPRLSSTRSTSPLRSVPRRRSTPQLGHEHVSSPLRSAPPLLAAALPRLQASSSARAGVRSTLQLLVCAAPSRTTAFTTSPPVAAVPTRGLPRRWPARGLPVRRRRRWSYLDRTPWPAPTLTVRRP
jgi:hypothetical protein